MRSREIRFIAVIVVCSLIIGCDSKKDPNQTADTIYTNGKIFTVNEAQPWAEAVAIKDGKFLKVGSSEEALSAKGKNTQVIDLDGKT